MVKATLRHSPIEKPIELHLETSILMYFLIETLTSLVRDSLTCLAIETKIEKVKDLELLMVKDFPIAILTNSKIGRLKDLLILIRL